VGGRVPSHADDVWERPPAPLSPPPPPHPHQPDSCQQTHHTLPQHPCTHPTGPCKATHKRKGRGRTGGGWWTERVAAPPRPARHPARPPAPLRSRRPRRRTALSGRRSTALPLRVHKGESGAHCAWGQAREGPGSEPTKTQQPTLNTTLSSAAPPDFSRTGLARPPRGTEEEAGSGGQGRP